MTMITCPNCGRRFDAEGVEFCPNPDCGYPVDFMTQPEDGVTEGQSETAAEEEGVLRRPEEVVPDAHPPETERDTPPETTEAAEVTDAPEPRPEPVATGASTPTTAFPTVSSPPEPDEVVPPDERGPRRTAPSVPVLLGIAAAVVLLVGLGAWALLSGSGDDDQVIGGEPPADPGGADPDPDPDTDDGGDAGDDQGDQGPGEPETFEVQVFFADTQAIANEDPPFVRPVPRRIPTPEEDPGVGRNTLAALLQGPTPEEEAAGLALVTSGSSGISAVDLVENVFVVQLAGGCDHGGLPVTIADLITPSLKQFGSVDFVQVFDAQGNTQRPGEAADSIPDCLDQAAQAPAARSAGGLPPWLPASP